MVEPWKSTCEDKCENLKVYLFEKLLFLLGFKVKNGLEQTEQYQHIWRTLKFPFLFLCLKYVVQQKYLLYQWDLKNQEYTCSIRNIRNFSKAWYLIFFPIVCIGVSTSPLKNTNSLFLSRPPPPLKSANCPSPPFLGNPSSVYWIFVTPPPPPQKSDSSVNPKNIKICHP